MITTALTIFIRVTVLLAAAAGMTTLLRRSPAATRHLIWTCALAASLLMPVLSAAFPAWEVPLLSQRGASPLTEGRETSAASGLSLADATRPAPTVTAPPRISNPAAVLPASVSPVSSPVWDVRRVVVFAWLLGMSLVLLRLAIGTTRMWWIASRASRVRPGGWLRFAERLAGALRIRRRVVFLEGGEVAMPMTWGVRTSRVLLPRTAREWPLARQRVVLLHELAHVKRRDCLTQLLAQVACAIYWFNPLVWFAASRLRIERERACDDLVLAAGTRGSEYADHLIEVARSMRSAMLPTWAAVAMAHRSQLEGRLMAILDPRIPRRFPTRTRSVTLVASMGLLAIPIAVITPTPKAAEAGPSIHASANTPQAAAMRSPTPQPAPSPRVEASAEVPQDARGDLAAATREAIADAVPEAERDLAREGWLGPVVDGTARAIGDAVGQAVGGVSGGIPGGVRGGVRDGGSGPETQASRDPRAVAALVEALKDSDKEVRETAMQALANMRAPEALGAIRVSLTDSNPSVREQAAFALGQYRDRTSVDALIGALQDASADVREQVVFALGQLRDPRAAAPLGRSLQDADASVREQAAFALGQLRSSEAVEPLGRALQDRSADVREQAAFALGQIRDKRAVDPLVAALKDENADVREQAAFALGQLRDPRATEALTIALKDPNVEVRRQAAFALAQVTK